MQTNDSLTGLVNKLTGAGTDRDKITGQEWFYAEPRPEQLRNSYRANWLCRKAVDAPVGDMLRQGWTWRAGGNEATLIQREEKRLRFKEKLKKALRWSRLYGGAAILIGDGAADPTQPLDVASITQNGLQYLTVMSRYEVGSGRIVHDVMNPLHGLPMDYQLSGSGAAVTVHPSRIIRFEGKSAAHTGSLVFDMWGDSVLAGILREIGAVATGIASSSRLLEESTVNYYKMKGLLEKLGTPGGEDIVQKALHLLNTMKSAINAVAVDADDGDLQQFHANFAGLPEVVQMLLQAVSGGADIPITRLLGQSPGGMNATGDSDFRNYYDGLKAEQEDYIGPAIEPITRAIVRSALGGEPDGVEFEFNPLWQMTDKDQSEIDSLQATTLTTLNNTGQVPDEVMSIAVRSMMSRSRNMAAAGDRWTELVEENRGEELERDPPESDVQEAISTGDSRPMTLYVARRVVNHEEIERWAKSQGLETTLGEDMHVTIAFSRQALDWHKVGHSWEDKIEIPEGGPRSVEVFGKNAVVLQIAWDSLQWRHQQIISAGATWDHDEYSPHITITYDPGDVDPLTIKPYRGKIVLGPEIFDQVNENWREGVSEDSDGLWANIRRKRERMKKGARKVQR